MTSPLCPHDCDSAVATTVLRGSGCNWLINAQCHEPLCICMPLMHGHCVAIKVFSPLTACVDGPDGICNKALV